MDPPSEKFELHFFWTTGRQPAPNEIEAKKVIIGGEASYEEAFFSVVEQELQKNNDFDVVIVCDSSTIISNKDKFEALKQQYNSRFSVRTIDSVIHNLVKVFPEREFILDKIFRNATNGNPVIASDFYRIIGLLFGGDSPIIGRLFAYCDVDLFTHKNAQIMASLRKTFDGKKTNGPHQNWYGMAPDNNDLIKHYIVDRLEHFHFCAKALLTAEKNYSWPGQKPQVSILDYYPLFEHAALQAQKDPASGFFYYEKNVHPFMKKNLLREIQFTTGAPFFASLLEHENVQYLEYEKYCPGRWIPDDSLIPISSFNEHWQFLFSIEPFSFSLSEICKYEELVQYFFNIICQYDEFFKAYVFTKKRYGNEHPLALRLKQKLIEEFPFTSNAFKTFLTQYWMDNYASIGLTLTNWPKEAFKRLNLSYENNDDNFFSYIVYKLKSAGVDIHFVSEGTNFPPQS